MHGVNVCQYHSVYAHARLNGLFTMLFRLYIVLTSSSMNYFKFMCKLFDTHTESHMFDLVIIFKFRIEFHQNWALKARTRDTNSSGIRFHSLRFRRHMDQSSRCYRDVEKIYINLYTKTAFAQGSICSSNDNLIVWASLCRLWTYITCVLYHVSFAVHCLDCMG